MARIASQSVIIAALALWCALAPTPCLSGAQKYEPLADAVRTRLNAAIADRAALMLPIRDGDEANRWMRSMSERLARFIPKTETRRELLTSVHYEATRAGLDPQLILGLIHIESGFRKYAVSAAGARGYMQVMPFWPRVIGSDDHNLFHLRTNLRYGCTILRHYLDLENGDLFRALGRYNGSLGRSDYPQKVHRAWTQTWSYRVATSE